MLHSCAAHINNEQLLHLQATAAVVLPGARHLELLLQVVVQHSMSEGGRTPQRRI